MSGFGVLDVTRDGNHGGHLAKAIMNFAAGALSDRYGRKPRRHQDDSRGIEDALHQLLATGPARTLLPTAAAVENLADRDGPPVFPRLLDRPRVGESEYE